MVIAVVSDSHNNKEAVFLAKKKIQGCDALIFLGDGEEDLEELSADFSGEVYAVCGNCDFKMKNPRERLIEIEGKRIYMTHGNKYNVNMGITSIYYRGVEVEADIVLFGHTHVPIISHEENMVLMNPGSISRGRGFKYDKSIGFIKICNNSLVEVFIEELK